jgi:hypothetical protein
VSFWIALVSVSDPIVSFWIAIVSVSDAILRL